MEIAENTITCNNSFVDNTFQGPVSLSVMHHTQSSTQKSLVNHTIMQTASCLSL